MNAQYILIAAAALVACAACTKSVEQPEPEGIQMTYRAYQEGAQDTKTTVQDGGTQVLWEPADEIKVFFNSFTGRFVSQNSEPAGVAVFSGTLNVLIGAIEGYEAANQTWGLYPYRADAAYDGEYVTTALPAAQTGKAGSFAKNTHICLARSGGHDLAFYNVTGGLRFSLTQEGINSVTFEGNDGEAIAGKIKMTFEDGVPVVKEVSEGESTVTLTAPNGGTFQPGQWYYIEAIPGTLTKGFTMVFTKGRETATLNTDVSVSIRRGKYGSLADADDGLIFKPTGGDEPDPSANIQFADPIAKYACVEKFDANGDGEVSYEEAAAATNLAGLFTDWNTVTSFDELQYFTSVTSISGVFSGLQKFESVVIPANVTNFGSGTFNNCKALASVALPEGMTSIPSSCFSGCIALKSLTIPSTVTSIGSSAFSGCTLLESVNIPSGVKTVPDYCFQNCSSLETLVLPSTVTDLNQYAFSGCSSLVNIELPSGLKTIGNYTFQNCSALASLDFPTSLTGIGYSAFSGCTGLTSISLGSGVSIGSNAFSGCTGITRASLGSSVTIGTYAFYNCSSLASIILPSDLKSIPDYCFQNCYDLSSITWPEALSSIGNRAFEGCRFKGNNYTLQLPSTVISIGSQAFTYLPHLIIPSTSAVSIQSNSFGPTSYTFLYVPKAMVEMYKVRTNWSNYAERIRPIRDYPASFEVAVDLGLSVKWASWNIGASTPEEYGTYFAWGETEPKADYSWGTYKWSSSLTKYNSSDGKTVLELEDDAARVNWGGSWRMPTDAEWRELKNYCNWIWTTRNGVNGYNVSRNGNTIFLPAAGRRFGTDLFYVGSNCIYWSSSLYTGYPDFAWSVDVDSSNVSGYLDDRYRGQSVRPVTE